MSKQQGKRRCPFCGGTPVSKEHVWPQWLRRTEIGAASFATRTHGEEPHVIMRSEMNTVNGEPAVVVSHEFRGRSVPPLDLTAKVPCRPCNNGWMAQLEADAKPILEPMMHGDPTNLSREQAAVLCRWATKTSAIFEFNDPPTRTYSREVLQALAIGAPLPGHWLIGLFEATDTNYFRLSHTGGGVVFAEDAASGSGIEFARASQTLLAAGPVTFLVRYVSAAVGLSLLTQGLEHLPEPPMWLHAGHPVPPTLPAPVLDPDGWQLLTYGDARMG